MLTYLLQRVIYAVPVVLLVALITFVLFFMLVPPEILAKRLIGAKNPSPEDIRNWLETHGYDKPLFLNLNAGADGRVHPLDSQAARYVGRLLRFDFGKSDQTGERISGILLRHMGPSLMLTVPAFTFSLLLSLSISLFVAYCRGTYMDRWALLLCVLLMAVPSLVFIIGGQWLGSLILRLFPVHGWDQGVHAAKFIYLPFALAIFSGLGGNIRFYRTAILEELNRDYVRTARAKGMSETRILFRDVLKNSMIPILTSAVMSIPFLMLGSLLLENFFGIPGLGSRMVDAIHASDFALIRALVFVGTLLYILGLLLTDISYTLVNPRVRFDGTPLGRMVLPVAVCTLVVLAAGCAVRILFRTRPSGSPGWSLPAPWVIENLLVLGLITGGVALVFRLRRKPHWRQAFAQVTRDRLARVALAVIAAFLLLAVLDSISWKNQPSDLRPRSLLDRVFVNWCWALPQERTYSAPLASQELTGRPPRPLQSSFHLLGTDSIGSDVLYQALKGIRTAVVVGVFPMLLIIPIAAAMGIAAGYFRGWVDDTVQFLYTILASIPEILLLLALMMALGKGLPQLCFVLGITSWVGLCRLLRAETLKIRELEYVQGARALGLRTPWILWRHVLPNVAHLIIIASVLRFGGLVMSEVILSYLGIGVEPGTASWGTMIDGARLELARDPMVWWNLGGAFGAMLVLLLCFNYFGDLLRDALDPRLKGR